MTYIFLFTLQLRLTRTRVCRILVYETFLIIFCWKESYIKQRGKNNWSPITVPRTASSFCTCCDSRSPYPTTAPPALYLVQIQTCATHLITHQKTSPDNTTKCLCALLHVLFFPKLKKYRQKLIFYSFLLMLPELFRSITNSPDKNFRLRHDLVKHACRDCSWYRS